jgi:hypothetical protein
MAEEKVPVAEKIINLTIRLTCAINAFDLELFQGSLLSRYGSPG